MALFVKKYFCKELVKLQSYKSKDYKSALEESFLKMDDLMNNDAGQKELIKISKAAGNDEVYDGKSYAGCTATVIL